MAKADPVLAKVKAICLSLPDTKLTMTWGSPHFRVGEKIFAGYGAEGSKPSIGLKLEMAHAQRVLDDPRFERAAYVGHKGWVSMDVSRVTDWEEVRALIHESYRLIAPKRSLAKLGEAAAPRPAKRAARQPAKLRSPRTPAKATARTARVPRARSR
ncbi:MAG TPA: MmcQ/YjbR family DNA-binding protein [Polyangiaceae bacterium]|nr:MmcQ/YjbR family DNA-binding protein [Polyangiaceae bacterium]